MTAYSVGSEDGQNKSLITFHCHFRTPGTEVFTRRIIEQLPNPGAVELLFAYIMSNTRHIEFLYDETAPRSEVMMSLEQFWFWALEHFYKLDSVRQIIGITDDDSIVQKSFEQFNEMVFDKLQEHWAMAYKNAQVLFPSSVLVRPDELLTKEVGESPTFLVTEKNT